MKLFPLRKKAGRRPIPSHSEIAPSCHESLHTYRQQEDADAIWLAYTPRGFYRAAILHKGRMYRVCYSSLFFEFDEDEEAGWLREDTPLSHLAWWEPDHGESWFDDLESAREAALSVLAQLEENGDHGTIEYQA